MAKLISLLTVRWLYIFSRGDFSRENDLQVHVRHEFLNWPFGVDLTNPVWPLSADVSAEAWAATTNSHVENHECERLFRGQRRGQHLECTTSFLFMQNFALKKTGLEKIRCTCVMLTSRLTSRSTSKLMSGLTSRLTSGVRCFSRLGWRQWST